MSTRIDNNQMVDFTTAINKVPRAWNLLDSMGLAETQGISTLTAAVDVIQERDGQIGDKRRGSNRQEVGAESVITKHLSTSFFPLDSALRPQDVQNLRKFGTENDLDTMGDAAMRAMERIRRLQGNLREKALMEAIKGSSYSPNGTTEVYDYYSVFEVSALQKTVFFDLTNTASDPLAKAEEAYGHIIDNAQDSAASYEVVALCDRAFFTKLLANDTFMQAYLYTQSQVNPLRDRVGGTGPYRQFSHGGVLYIEYVGKFNGVPLIPVDTAYFLPKGIEDMFNVYHSPADTIADANTVGQELYMWTEETRRKLVVESETSFIAVNARPELVITASSNAS